MNSEQHERHPIKAVIVGIVYFILLVVVALISISMITSAYPGYAYIFDGVTMNILIFGTLVSILGAVTAYLNKGEIYRMISGIAKTVGLAVYIYTFITGLDLNIEIEQVTAEISIPGILMLLMILMGAKAGYFVLEYYLYGIKDEKIKEKNNPLVES
ncbi:MAG: hypothetical protein ACOC40_00420 [Thermoplasmatota archaeon]